MTRQKSSSTPQPPIAQAIRENGGLWFNLGQRELPPIAMLGAAALMLRNVSFQALVDAVAPALMEMVELGGRRDPGRARGVRRRGPALYLRPVAHELRVRALRLSSAGDLAAVLRCAG